MKDIVEYMRLMLTMTMSVEKFHYASNDISTMMRDARERIQTHDLDIMQIASESWMHYNRMHRIGWIPKMH